MTSAMWASNRSDGSTTSYRCHRLRRSAQKSVQRRVPASQRNWATDRRVQSFFWDRPTGRTVEHRIDMATRAAAPVPDGISVEERGIFRRLWAVSRREEVDAADPGEGTAPRGARAAAGHGPAVARRSARAPLSHRPRVLSTRRTRYSGATSPSRSRGATSPSRSRPQDRRMDAA